MTAKAMWVEGDQLTRLDSALEAGRATDIDRLLAEILAAGAPEAATPAACAICRRDLVPSELGRPGLVASTCPEGHGAWMSPDALGTLRRLVDAHAASVRARRRIAVVSVVLASALAVLAMSGPLTDGSLLPRWIWARPMPAAERQYLLQLMTVLKDGAANRENIAGVLKTDSEPDTYGAVFGIYRGRAVAVIARLNALDVPRRLRPAHDRIVRAAERQVAFYADFTEARARDRSADLARMLGHPALRESSFQLHTAWDLIRRAYPDLAPAALKPIEDHLCKFDVI